jgi:hypothetical protein
MSFIFRDKALGTILASGESVRATRDLALGRNLNVFVRVAAGDDGGRV